MSNSMAIIVCALMVSGQPSEPARSSGDEPICLTRAMVVAVDDAAVPAQSAGVLASFDVRLGDMVRAGQPCARIGDEVARIERDIAAIRYKQAEVEAQNSVDRRYARAVAEVADVEHRQALTIDHNVPGAMGDAEIRRRALSRQRAEMAVEQADLEQQLAGITHQARGAELQLAEARLRQRTIAAPIDGVVVETYKHKGEWVNPGDTVLRIVRMDKVYVQAFVGPDQAGPEDLRNRVAKVMLTGNGDQASASGLEGQIVFCSPDLVGRKYRVQAEVTNHLRHGQWVLRPGQFVQLITVPAPAQPPERVAGAYRAALAVP